MNQTTKYGKNVMETKEIKKIPHFFFPQKKLSQKEGINSFWFPASLLNTRAFTDFSKRAVHSIERF